MPLRRSRPSRSSCSPAVPSGSPAPAPAATWLSEPLGAVQARASSPPVRHDSRAEPRQPLRRRARRAGAGPAALPVVQLRRLPWRRRRGRYRSAAGRRRNGSTAARDANIYASIVQGRPNGMPAFGPSLRARRSGSSPPTCKSLSEAARSEDERTKGPGHERRAGSGRSGGRAYRRALLGDDGTRTAVVFVVFCAGWPTRSPHRRDRPLAPTPEQDRRRTRMILLLGAVLPALILVPLLLWTFDSLAALDPAGAPARPGGRSGGQAVVVGDPLPRRGSGARLHHRERAARPGREAGGAAAHLDRRHPQLLGARAPGKDRPDPGPGERHLDRGRPARRLRRPVRRVLRHCSTRTWACWWSRSRRRSSSAWAAGQRAAGRRAGRLGTRLIAGTRSSASACARCHAVRGTPAGGNARARSHPRREPPDPRLPGCCPTLPGTSAAGSPTLRLSSQASRMPRVPMSRGRVPAHPPLPADPALAAWAPHRSRGARASTGRRRSSGSGASRPASSACCGRSTTSPSRSGTWRPGSRFFMLGGLLAALMRIQLGTPGQHLPRRGDLQPALHDARHDDDVPLRHPVHRGARELPAAAACSAPATCRSRG